MEPKVVNSTHLRQKTRDVLEDAKHHGQHFIVRTHGKPMVAIIGIDEYKELMGPNRFDPEHRAAATDSDGTKDKSLNFGNFGRSSLTNRKRSSREHQVGPRRVLKWLRSAISGFRRLGDSL